MAAPSGITWGSTVGGYGRIGIYTSTSNTNTETTVSVQVWLWTQYSCRDTNNTFYFDFDTSSASTSKGSVSISTSVDDGIGWNTGNQIKLGTYSKTYTRGTSAATKYCAAKLVNVDRVGGTMYVSKSFSVPAKPSYTVSYNANGGSGAPSSQTKWYGTNITLSSTKPTRTGHSFAGWATSSSGSVAYAAGATYSSNASVTLYAKWTANTYTVSYNANGGSGAPGSQTKTYGVNLTLSSTKPTRTNYNFKGWATTSGATSAAYSAGGTYTSNSAVTLYAVWELAYTKPRVTVSSCYRCDSSGNTQEGGTYARITFSWSTDKTVSSVYAYWKRDTDSSWSSVSCGGSGTSGSKTQTISGLSSDSAYTIRITVADSSGSTSVDRTVAGSFYLTDELSGGRGYAIGKAAEKNNYLDVALWSLFRKRIESTHTDCALEQTHPTTGYKVGIGIGSSGYNHGIYSSALGNWLIHNDGSATRIRANGHLWLTPGNGFDVVTNNRVRSYRPSETEPPRLFLADSVASSKNTAFHAIRNDTGIECWFGVGSGGTNHGVYSENVGGWILMNANNNTYIRAKSGNDVVIDQNDVYLQYAKGIKYAYNGSNFVHALSVASDRLSTYLGPPDISQNTVTYLRGKTVRIYNHSGGAVYLGSSGSTAVTSDRNLKKDITEIDDKYLDFFNRLTAVTYKYNDHNNIGHRDHIGFIAQDVEKALLDSGLTTEQFAGICIETDVKIDKDYDTATPHVDDYVPDPPVPKEDKDTTKEPVIDAGVKDKVAEQIVEPEIQNGTAEATVTEKEPKDTSVHYDKLYSLRYEEFIALNTHMIQRANKIMEEQQDTIEKQQIKINELEQRLLRLETMLGV